MGILYEEFIHSWNEIEEWCIEIDSLLFDDLGFDIEASELTALLLHEIGHIKYMELYGSIKNKPYKEVQEKEYLTLEQGLKAYREIPTEKYADEFAINFINKYTAELTNLLDPSQTIESVKEFLEME